MNRWSTLASLTLFIGALAHFLIVDLSVWILEAEYVRWMPESLLHQARSTVINWGYLGTTTFFGAFTGFSLWMVVSLITIGIYNILIFKNLPPGHSLRNKSLFVGLISAGIFLFIAALNFIYLSAVGGVLAVVFFVLGIVKEKASRPNIT